MKFSDFLDIHKCLMAYVLTAEQVFVLCVTGQIMTSKCETIALEFYQTNWYRFPLKIQMMSILLTKESQKSFIYKGGSMTRLILPTFMEVNKKCKFFHFIFFKIYYINI